jgi:hypothetical protein
VPLEGERERELVSQVISSFFIFNKIKW